MWLPGKEPKTSEKGSPGQKLRKGSNRAFPRRGMWLPMKEATTPEKTSLGQKLRNGSNRAFPRRGMWLPGTEPRTSEKGSLGQKLKISSKRAFPRRGTWLPGMEAKTSKKGSPGQKRPPEAKYPQEGPRINSTRETDTLVYTILKKLVFQALSLNTYLCLRIRTFPNLCRGGARPTPSSSPSAQVWPQHSFGMDGKTSK
jgi:hypothetical protein